MRKLPKAPSNDPVSEVWNVVGRFSSQLSRRLEGTPDADGILQNIRPHQQAFKRAIRATAPHFVPWKMGDTRELPPVDFLANEEDDPQEPKASSVLIPRSPTPQSEVIYIQDVLDRAQRSLRFIIVISQILTSS